VIAGPNGSGKSTLTERVDLEGRGLLLVPDEIARTAGNHGPASIVPPRDKMVRVEKVVRIFNSFEEADAADVEQDARSAPEQRIATVLELQTRIYPMPLNKDLREFIESLNSNGVKYLIVGAFAVAWYG
jgi:hypothetical protein